MDQIKYEHWFSFHDVCSRFLLTVLGFYVILFTHPLRLMKFSVMHLPNYYSLFEQIFFIVLLPFMPVAVLIYQVLIIPLKKKLGLVEDYNEDEAAVNFAKP